MASDESRKVVIEVTQPITNAEAVKLGKALGKAGFTGVFVGGDIAELAALGARYRKEKATRDAKEKADV